MSVSGINNALLSSNTPSANQTSSSNGILSQADFFQIITTQLENQDPDDAADTNQMVQSMMSMSNYQTTQQDGIDINNLKNYMAATQLVGQDVEINVPATNTAQATTTSGVATAVDIDANSPSGATITVNGTAYDLGDFGGIAQTAPASGNSN